MVALRPRTRPIDAEGFADRNRAWSVIERISLVLVAMSAGAVALLVTLASRVADGISEADEQAVYARTWPLALTAILVFPAITRFAARRWLPARTVFWPVLAVAHATFWLSTVVRMKRIGEEADAVTRGAHLEHLLRTRSWVPLGLTVGWFVLLFAASRLAERRATRNLPTMEAMLEMLASPWLGHLYLLVVLGELARILWPSAQLSYGPPALAGIGGAAVLLVVLARHALDERRAQTVWQRWSEHLLVLLTLTLVLWYPDIQLLHYPEGTYGSASADIWIDHYNFYLGPLEAVLAGRSPLVDVSSQYGVGVIYALAVIFKLHLFARSAVGLAHLICTLQILRFFLLYLTLRKISRSLFVSLVFVAVGLGVSTFAARYVYIRLPNGGPLRFFVEYVLVAAIAFPSSRGARRGPRFHVPRARALLVVAAGALWSPDVAVTVIGAYLGTCALVAWRRPTTLPSRAAAFARALFELTIALALALLLAQLYVRATTGTWPIWDRAIEHVRFYATWNVWIVAIDTWSPWILVSLVYVGSLAAVMYDGRATSELQAVAAMTLVGIAEMSYYVGRSYSGNLASVALPAVFVACYWASRLLRATGGLFRFLIASAASATVLLSFLPTLPGGVATLSYSLLVRTASGEQSAEAAPSAEAQEAAMLIEKYLPQRQRIAAFLSEDAEVETFLLTGKTQLWPLCYPPADALLPRSREAAVEYWPPLRRDDFLFLGPRLDPFQQEIWDGIAKRVNLLEVEKGPVGVRVMQVQDLRSAL